MNKEIWKDIKDYEGFYQVSNLGNVRSVPRNGTVKYYKILKPNNVKGYYQVTLQKKGKKKIYKVHRLVAKTFIKNTYNKREVNHIDGNKLNNAVTNLEWVTAKENSNHRVNVLNKKTTDNRKVGMFDKNSNLIQTFNSIVAAGQYFGKSRVNIDNALKHKNNQQTAYGYIWKYLD